MNKNSNNQVSTLALVLSVIAIVLSGYSVSGGAGMRGAAMDDSAFNEKVEKGIEAYVEKQRNAQGGSGGGQAAAAGEPVDVSIDDDAIKGDKNAPVTIVEFSDYECPFCARFYKNTLPQIQSEYIDTGKVRLIFRDFPLSFHRNARPASMAAECVREQGGDDAYYAYHDAIFENQTAGLGAENLKKWAVEVGAEEGAFTECLESEKYGAEVDKDFADGQAAGVSGTPGFFINGRKVSGAQPFSVFKTIIDEELAK